MHLVHRIGESKLPKILVVSAYLDYTFTQVTKDIELCTAFAADNNIPIILVHNRGEILEKWIGLKNLFILNKGSKPTFVTRRARSIIDVTLVSEDLLNLAKGWKVLDMDSLSDHKYITFKLEVGKIEFKKLEMIKKLIGHFFRLNFCKKNGPAPRDGAVKLLN
jgi:hypothetical protein